MKPGDLVTVTSREQLKELYGWEWPQSDFETRALDILEIRPMKLRVAPAVAGRTIYEDRVIFLVPIVPWFADYCRLLGLVE
jgi:hypothetical protein